MRHGAPYPGKAAPNHSRLRPEAALLNRGCYDGINLEQIAIKLKRKLCWDPAREVFVNDDEANRMLDRPMHNGWKL